MWVIELRMLSKCPWSGRCVRSVKPWARQDSGCRVVGSQREPASTGRGSYRLTRPRAGEHLDGVRGRPCGWFKNIPLRAPTTSPLSSQTLWIHHTGVQELEMGGSPGFPGVPVGPQGALRGGAERGPSTHREMWGWERRGEQVSQVRRWARCAGAQDAGRGEETPLPVALPWFYTSRR